MGRYLSLSDMGTYGLVFGTVMVLITFLGQRFDYIVMREIVGRSPATGLHKMRDQAVLYGINGVLLAVIMLGMAVTGAGGVATKTLVYIFLLSVFEGYAGFVYNNMNSLNRQVMANVQFFLRSGLWVLPVVALGLIDPSYRTVDTVLTAWTGGILASYGVVAWTWRAMPWREISQRPVDWVWIKRGLKKSSLIWLGALGLVAGVYVDRFIALRFLTLDDVGVITFYASFSNAMLALLQSGVAAFAHPRLIVFHREGKKDRFRKEARRMIQQIAMGGAVMAVGLGIAVPLLGGYTGHPEYQQHVVVLWLILAGTWIRANAEALYLILFARHQDRPIWLGNLLYLVPALICNLVLVPYFGLEGVGYGTILATLFLFVWRACYTFRPLKYAS
jgi:O-antigen/teichoic acid export membrane protein